MRVSDGPWLGAPRIDVDDELGFDGRGPELLRQGEWFFVPEPHVWADERRILRNERLARAGETPHILRKAFRPRRQHGVCERRQGDPRG